MDFYQCTEPQAMIVACIMDIRQTAKKEEGKKKSLSYSEICFVVFCESF